MGNNRPIPIGCWENFLISKGCEFVRIRASHHHWKCPNCLRPITFWGNEKEIPGFHIKTCLNTLGIKRTSFLQWVKENC